MDDAGDLPRPYAGSVMSNHVERRSGVHGILAPAVRLDRWLPVVLAALVVTSAARYVDRHGLGVTGVLVLLGAAALALGYATRPLLPGRSWWPTVWVAGIVVVWAALTLAAPSFAWCAVPVAFAVLQVFRYPVAAVTVVAMTLVVGAAWLRVTHSLDPTLVVGPVGVALVTLIAYRSLEREARVRQLLLDELTEAQADLAEEQHRSGALAERARLSREIHDSVGQGLSSINLLLQAAEQAWDADPGAARGHVGTASATARDGLDEVRRVVRDLAPAELSGDARSLEDALRRVVAAHAPGAGRERVELRVHGDPVAVSPAVATALLRTTRGALANVREHAAATRVVVSLTWQADEVLLDVRDDGCGFTDGPQPGGLRGRGLAGIRERAVGLGGSGSVESAPGEGTTVSVRLPVEEA